MCDLFVVLIGELIKWQKAFISIETEMMVAVVGKIPLSVLMRVD